MNGVHVTSIRCLKFIFSPIRNAGDSGFIEQSKSAHMECEYDDARGAASAHPAAVRAELRPYAVAHHLPAAPPPKQQPALQPAAYPAHHGSTCEQRDLRARVSGPRDAVKTRAQQSSKRKAPLTATPLLLALARCSSDVERLNKALQACNQKSLSMILALRLTVVAKRCDVVRQRVADETRRGRAARFICPAACACSPDVHMGRNGTEKLFPTAGASST
jgi:hypothetical protein